MTFVTCYVLNRVTTDNTLALTNMKRKITYVNSGYREWAKHRYILAFGAYATTYLYIFADSLEDALDEAGAWLAENAPGLLADQEVIDEYNCLKNAGASEEEAREAAEVDTVILDGGHYLHSSEWTIIAEDPSPEDVRLLRGVV